MSKQLSSLASVLLWLALPALCFANPGGEEKTAKATPVAKETSAKPKDGNGNSRPTARKASKKKTAPAGEKAESAGPASAPTSRPAGAGKAERFPVLKADHPRSSAPDLSEAPRRTAAGFEKSYKEKRIKAEAIVARVLKALKAVGSWNLESGNQAQVQAAVRKIKTEGKKLEEAGELYADSFNVEKLSLKLYIRAAQVKELTSGQKTDVSRLNARLMDLTFGRSQTPTQARISGLKLLVEALVEYIQGHLAEAIVLTSRSTRVDATIALSHAYQGSFYYLTQNKKLAVASWTRALKLDPKNDEVRQALKAVNASRAAEK